MRLAVSLARGAVVGAHAQNLRMYGRKRPPRPGCPSLREARVPPSLPRMAAAQGQFSDDADGTEGTGSADGSSVPIPFRTAVEALRAARPRPEIEIDPTPPPQRLAPYAYALEAAVVDGEDDLADGRLDPAARPGRPRRLARHLPAGHARTGGAGAGDGRRPAAARRVLVVADGRAARRAGCRTARRAAPSPARVRTTSAGCRSAGPRHRSRSGRPGRRARACGGVPDTAAHLAAWCDLLCQIAGLPPTGRRDGAAACHSPAAATRDRPPGGGCHCRSGRGARRPELTAASRRVTARVLRSSRSLCRRAFASQRPAPPSRRRAQRILRTPAAAACTSRIDDRSRVRIARIVTHQIVIIL